MTMNDAIKIVRSYLKEHYIVDGFEFNGKYIFGILSKGYKKMYTDYGGYVSVDKNTGDIYQHNAMYLAELWETEGLTPDISDKAIKIDEIEEA